MLDDQASRTLVRPAVLRATHQLLDAPLILDDPISVGLIPEAISESILPHSAELRSARMSLLRSAFVLRSRFAEDQFAKAVKQGVRQLVILGAGLETFPWRQPPFANSSRIFVTDHPASARHAQQVRMTKGWKDPGNVKITAIDLEHRDFMAVLAQQGLREDQSAFFTMLGLSQYLSHEAIANVYEVIARRSAQSILVLSYNPPDHLLDADDLALAMEAANRTSTFSEPWLFRPTTEALDEQLRRSGFHDVRHLLPAEAQVAYFAERADHLRAPRFEQLMEARTRGASL